MRNVLFVISGPSGVGKGTIVNRLMEIEPTLAKSVSCTTRLPREGEKDGDAYYFISEREFRNRIAENDFLEYDEHFGKLYGTPRSFVERQLKERSVILEIDVVGGLNCKRMMPDSVLIMVTPPSLEALEVRIDGRENEEGFSKPDRLHRVRYELEQSRLYDYTVVNDRLDDAVERIRAIIRQEENK